MRLSSGGGATWRLQYRVAGHGRAGRVCRLVVAAHPLAFVLWAPHCLRFVVFLHKTCLFFIPFPASPGLGLQPRAVGVPGRGPEGMVSQYPSERAWRGRGRRNPGAPLPRPGSGTAHRDWPCAHPPAARAEAPRTAALPPFPELTSCGPRTFERGSRDRLDQELVAGVRDTCPFLPQDSGHPCTAADPDRCLTPVSPQHFIDLFKF